MKFIKRDAFYPEEAAAPKSKRSGASKKQAAAILKLTDWQAALAARTSLKRGREIADALTEAAKAKGGEAVLELMSRALRMKAHGFPAALWTDAFSPLAEHFLAGASIKPAAVCSGCAAPQKREAESGAPRGLPGASAEA